MHIFGAGVHKTQNVITRIDALWLRTICFGLRRIFHRETWYFFYCIYVYEMKTHSHTRHMALIVMYSREHTHTHTQTRSVADYTRTDTYWPGCWYNCSCDRASCAHKYKRTMEYESANSMLWSLILWYTWLYIAAAVESRAIQGNVIINRYLIQPSWITVRERAEVTHNVERQKGAGETSDSVKQRPTMMRTGNWRHS